MKKILLIFLFIIFADSLLSQVNLEWIKRFPNQINAPSLCSDMVIDRSGNIYVSGSTGVAGEGLQMILIKYKPDGSTIWVRYFGGAFNHSDGSTAMLKDKFDNIYLTGYTTTSTFSALDIATLKFDSSGALLWSNIFSNGVGIDDYPYAISIDSSLNVFVSGFTYGGGRDGLLIKMNSNGVQQWFSTYRSFSNYSDEAYSVCADFNGNSYIALLASDTGNGNIGIIKYDPNGTMLWMNKYRGPVNSFDYPSRVIRDDLNNIYIIGTTQGITNEDNFVTLKYDQYGNKLWEAIYDGDANGQDYGYDIAFDNNWYVIVTGASERLGDGSDFTTIKYSSNGVSQWVSRFSHANSTQNIPLKLAVDNLNNIFVTGTATFITTYDDISSVKYNNNGNLIWSYKFNGNFNGNDFPSAIVADLSNNIYITGATIEENFNNLITTLKFTQPIGITPIISQIPSQFSLSQNYPNPFNPATKIKFQIPLLRGVDAEGSRGVFVQLSIHDILGREVTVSVNDKLAPGTYEIDWDASAFPSGVYFYTITSGEYSETRKMVLLK